MRPHPRRGRGSIDLLRLLANTKTCDRCGAICPPARLNVEAIVHHGERELVCIDRKSCERRRRKRD